MRNITCVSLAVAAAIPALVLAQQPLRIDKISVSPPATVSTIEIDKGQPSRLAWSPDGSELYIQTLEGSFADYQAQRGKFRLEHVLVPAGDGKQKKLDAEPEWVAAYWTAKSFRHAPGTPSLSIELKTEQRQETTTSVPRGGDLAKGGTGGDGGTSAGDAGAAAYNRQTVTEHSYRLLGQSFGLFTNSVVVHGLTFGWGPAGANAIAFTTQKGSRIVVMDDRGTTKEIPDSANSLLPAWSPDGRRVAWLQKDGRKKFQVQVISLLPM